MNSQLAGTIAIVTGASSGIGAATARSLAGHGASVAVVARRKDRLDTLVSGIEAAGGTAWLSKQTSPTAPRPSGR
ncbi:MAG: sle [Arthrobacter sp.]|nr:sle [Arthrobacter sp.]